MLHHLPHNATTTITYATTTWYDLQTSNSNAGEDLVLSALGRRCLPLSSSLYTTAVVAAYLYCRRCTGLWSLLYTIMVFCVHDYGCRCITLWLVLYGARVVAVFHSGRGWATS